MNFHLKWSDLPPHLRKILIPAMILTVLVGFGGFMLSFQALSDWAKSTKLFPEEWSWIFPLIVDGGLVVGELLTVAAVIVAAPKLFPAAIMMLFGAATVWINLIHAPSDWGIRITAILPPTATICATLGIAWLGRRIAEALGMQLTYTPPPATSLPPLPAQAWRTDGGPYPSPWAVPSAGYPQLPPGSNPYGPPGSNRAEPATGTGLNGTVRTGSSPPVEGGSNRPSDPPSEGAGDTAPAGSRAPRNGGFNPLGWAARTARDWRTRKRSRPGSTSDSDRPGPPGSPRAEPAVEAGSHGALQRGSNPRAEDGSNRAETAGGAGLYSAGRTATQPAVEPATQPARNHGSTSGNGEVRTGARPAVRTGVEPAARPALDPPTIRGGILLPNSTPSPGSTRSQPPARPGSSPDTEPGSTAGSNRAQPAAPAGFEPGPSGLLEPARPATRPVARRPVDPPVRTAPPSPTRPGPNRAGGRDSEPARPDPPPSAQRGSTRASIGTSNRAENSDETAGRAGSKRRRTRASQNRRELSVTMRDNAEAFVREHITQTGQLPTAPDVRRKAGAADDGWGRKYLREHGDQLLREVLGDNVRQIRAQQQ